MDNKKRFIIEIGTGIDIHGEDMTRAACRAVEDAVSRSCLCGLVEVLGVRDMSQIEVEIQVAAPIPEKVDLEAVMKSVPIGRKTVQALKGGMTVKGLCVPEFGPDCDQIVIANAALTVWVRVEK
jgi:uncharacterized protein (TIGR02058 family)